ncbi:phosphoribosylformylglycinamidine synthase subunit PurL [Terriglobus roseus]|uniref:Phosphoribosylformylglycinamidine synthase subunit PurL n=1 Tax=Terriglobus roseus TaxID=392734 RepID=A0A1G7N3G3_9BACT|nr:phosphoribosylformylglycinamidine synthase subunit PurL [Terriglobus roseus]SDF68544.1 phosphoribosylformylglycinamidine synthase [Terriglobus roseus]
MSEPTAIPHEAEAVATTPAAAQSHEVPKQCNVTPELLKVHNITDEEYAKILATMGRTPSLTELGIYSVMWSEHCSYKSSRVHLKRLPTKGTRASGPGSVMQGPGENAGIIDVGDGWACAFKIESHNHPSYIEPYQGAATGVGGILRDIFTMGARPYAVMDSLRFGPLSPATGSKDVQKHASADESFHGVTEDTSEEADSTVKSAGSDDIDYAKNRSVMEGVVHGVAGYGNCFGVPNVGGETRFEECYSTNPLLNAFALGLVRHDEIFYAKATGVGNPVIYVGAKTGRDGIHGATMASEEFKEGSEQKRPNVQMGDPFLEKLLLEACLEAMKTGAVAGIQDMGAAGLTCSTCEMGGRGGVGLEIELDLVPQRDSGMSSYEIMLSESQERMLLVAHAGREQEVLDVFEKWGLDASVVGTVIPENRMKVRHHGELVADLSNESLTDDAPVYHRPVGEWKAPVSLDAPAAVLAALQKPRDYTADLKKLLASPNICDKRHIYEQYDSMVQTNTVQGPGCEAGVIRIKGTGGDGKPERGLAMALAGNGRWTWLDPKLGAMHAVAEAARKVACTGATPVSATNCLNFGNPQKPEIMAQLSQAIDGISEACTALGTPITGGNVSLYNETKGEGIFPTPVLGIVGIMDDVTKAVPNGFLKEGNDVLLLIFAKHGEASGTSMQQLGSTAFAQSVLGATWGVPPFLDLRNEKELQDCLIELADKRLLASACDASDGGIQLALAKASIVHGIGVVCDPTTSSIPADSFWNEDGSIVIVSCTPANTAEVIAVAQKHGADGGAYKIGTTVKNQFVVPHIATTVDELTTAFTGALEEELEAEVVLA